MFSKGSFGGAEDLFAALVADISMEWPPGGGNAYECILTSNPFTCLQPCKSSSWHSPTPNHLGLAAQRYVYQEIRYNILFLPSAPPKSILNYLKNYIFCYLATSEQNIWLTFLVGFSEWSVCSLNYYGQGRSNFGWDHEKYILAFDDKMSDFLFHFCSRISPLIIYSVQP